jgi:RecB family endonuclease NucS
MTTEANLRDYLAGHLHLIEEGLQLRAKEFRLENSLGTAGRIDILASDRFAATVVIELKKTDQSARQALHEIHKYVALLKRPTAWC